jgi:signal peptidase I
MQPTYHEGQRVFVAKYLFQSPSRGDVVVFKPPTGSHDEYIKRIVGVPGDHVVVQDGTVSVNGRVLDEPYIHGLPTTCTGNFCDVTLGPGMYYVMGDNRPDSADSRFFGPIAGGSIDGRAWLRYFPFGDFKLDP